MKATRIDRLGSRRIVVLSMSGKVNMSLEMIWNFINQLGGLIDVSM